MAEAASVPLVGLTAWQALVERAQPAARPEGPHPRRCRRRRHHRHPAGQTPRRECGHDRERDEDGPGESLGADVVIDYRKQAFDTILHDYDVVLDTVGGDTLDKSLRVLKPGGTVVSITGPPDPAFAHEIGAHPVIRLAIAALSYRIRRRARRHQVTYSYLFIKASGDQLRELTALIDARTIRPVMDSVFDFDQTREALAHLEQGRTKAGKIVIRMT